MSTALYILLAGVAYVGVVMLLERVISGDPLDWED